VVFFDMFVGGLKGGGGRRRRRRRRRGEKGGGGFSKGESGFDG
jgi:hypothetical protein